GIKKVKYEETEQYLITKQFLNDYPKMLEILMDEEKEK
ncbi:MAG: AAA family ATPase, partial [Bacteroidia bacterium]|nr:AAA family ATPase [Bacteroidia bacterium]